MKIVFLKVLAFVVFVDVIYMGIGQTLQQVEVHPPPKLVITVDTDIDELTSMGETLFTENRRHFFAIVECGGMLVCTRFNETTVRAFVRKVL